MLDPQKALVVKRLGDQAVLPLIAAVFFVLTFAIKAFTDGPYVRGEVSSMVAYTKYATAFVACFAALIYAFENGERLFVSEFNKLMAVAVLFIVVSVGMQVVSNNYSTTVYVELAKFAMPIVLAYCMLNALSERAIFNCMVCVLVVSLAGYFVELRSQNASIFSLFQADFDNFNSETEASGFAEIALMLTLYFAYFRKSKLALFVSFFFSVLVFKRLAMLIAVMAVLISLFAPKLMHRHISKGVLRGFKIATLLLALLWFVMLLPEHESFFVQVFGKSPFEFTMGRSTSLRYLWLSDFQSYGFGSANETIDAVFGVPFEMDLAKIAFELTPFTAIVFVWLFWDVAGDSFWGVFIVGYYMLNMITSDSLTSNFSFTLAYIVIGLVNQSEAKRSVAREEQSAKPDRRKSGCLKRKAYDAR